MEPVYQEADSTFGSDGKIYELNQLWQAVAHQPVRSIEVSKLAWVLKHLKESQDEARIERTDLTAPLLVTHYRGQELVVDGLHRLLKAVRSGVLTLPYRRVSADALRRSNVRSALESCPSYYRW